MHVHMCECICYKTLVIVRIKCYFTMTIELHFSECLHIPSARYRQIFRRNIRSNEHIKKYIAEKIRNGTVS